MNQNIYEEYSKVRELINQLTEKQKQLETEILNEIKDLSTTMVSTKGSFSKVVRKNYVFSPVCVEKQKQISENIKKYSQEISKPLEDLKKSEIEQGIATVEESISLRYTPKKEK